MADQRQKHAHDLATLEWEPWEGYFPGVPPCEGPFGGWVKVLHRSTEKEPGWTFLFKWTGWPGKVLRLVAIVPEGSDEHVFTFAPGVDATVAIESAKYAYRPTGERHVGNFGEDFTMLLSFRGEPDVVLSWEFRDR